MARTVEELAKEALSLPSELRAQLADLLVESLEGDDIEEPQEAWVAEAKRRRDDVRDGKVRTVPGEEALSRVRDSIRR
jgi:putative addiction module component (TIGR02574 family)